MTANDGTSLRPERVGYAAGLLLLPPAGWVLWQLPVEVLIGLALILAAFLVGVVLWCIRPLAVEAPAPPPPAPAEAPVVVEVPDELGEAITGLLEKVDLIDARQQTLELGLQRVLAAKPADAEPPRRPSNRAPR